MINAKDVSMKIVNLASKKSAWRGYEYYKEGNVVSFVQTSEGIYQGKVLGSNRSAYNVKIDINHPRNSSCDCPFAKNSVRIVCKHQVALFFATHPQDAKEYKKFNDEAQIEYDEWIEKLPESVEFYVRSLGKEELQEQLLDILFSGNDWLLDRYIREHDLYDI